MKKLSLILLSTLIVSSCEKTTTETVDQYHVDIFGQMYEVSAPVALINESNLELYAYDHSDGIHKKVIGSYNDGAVRFVVDVIHEQKSKSIIYMNDDELHLFYDNVNGVVDESYISPENADAITVTAAEMTLLGAIAEIFSHLTVHSTYTESSDVNSLHFVDEGEDFLYQHLTMISHFYGAGGTITTATAEQKKEQALLRQNEYYCPGTTISWNTSDWGECSAGWCSSDSYTTTGTSNYCHGRCGGGCDEIPWCLGNRYTWGCGVHDGTGNAFVFTAFAASDCLAVLVSSCF